MIDDNDWIEAQMGTGGEPPPTMHQSVEEVVEEVITSSTDTEGPYIMTTIQRTVVARRWNPEYNETRICVCGHPYHRHFDTYDRMAPIGCKYCSCLIFQPRD